MKNIKQTIKSIFFKSNIEFVFSVIMFICSVIYIIYIFKTCMLK